MFKYHLCIIIILYKRERCAARARCRGAGGLRTRTSTNVSFFFSYLVLSPKYTINHFSPSFMQNSYSDNRCCGVSYPTLCAIACACTRAIAEPMLYTIFPSVYRCVPFHVSLRSSLRCVTLCPYMPLFSRLSTIVLQPFGFQYRRLPFYRCLIFRQPPPPLLSLVSVLSYNRSGPLFFFNPLVSSDFHVGEYGLRHIYLTEVGTAISSSASSSSLAISCLFAAPSRRKSESERWQIIETVLTIYC